MRVIIKDSIDVGSRFNLYNEFNELQCKLYNFDSRDTLTIDFCEIQENVFELNYYILAKCSIMNPEAYMNPMEMDYDCERFVLKITPDDIIDGHLYDLLVEKLKKDDKSEPNSNPYWENITKIAEKQREKGLKEYGKGIESNNSDILERINMLEEELVDGLMYLEWVKDYIRKK